ncbi:MAG: glycosyltransferase family 2 protein [Oscillospiraceae bacterium]|nr:glycosyltransferase family 2 protein [Oscillospiraceae bacterium]
MSNAVISIFVPTFNHENYIARALDSILMQKTQYSYEVFVGEDCSTDNTRQVVKDWEAAHPDDRFHFFYRQQNMHNSGLTNTNDLKSRCKGKYIIGLEGDDFWTDDQKLEKQISFLEAHPQYYAVAHNCTVVGKDHLPNGETYPECKDTEYTFRHFASQILPGQYTTFLSRNYWTDPQIDKTLLSISGGAGDQRIYFSILCFGRIYCMQENMSAYRHITNTGTSFSATNRYNFERLEADALAYLEFTRKIGHAQAEKYAEFQYLRTLRHAYRTGHIDITRFKACSAHIHNKLRSSLMLLKRDINCRILHKSLHV